MKAVFHQKFFASLTFVILFAAISAKSQSPSQPLPDPSPAQSVTQPQIPSQDVGSHRGQRMRGLGSGDEGPGGVRGMLGTVTEVAGDHYVIKNDSGETYIVHFSVNTRMMKQAPGRPENGRRQRGQVSAAQGQNGQSQANAQPNSQGGSSSGQSVRPMPETIKATDIKVGDVITAGGEVDAANKSIGAIFIAQLDPERAKQMREMQANYGKTWLAGRITAIDGTRITIEGMIDHTPHAVEVDENTSFRQRRDSITLADIKPGEQLRAEGAMKSGVFLATTVNAMTPQNRPEHDSDRARAPQ